MYLFPERAYRSGRRFLVLAAILSLIIHLAGGSLWAVFKHTVVGPASATGASADTPTLSDAITIEHRNTPRVSDVARGPKQVVPKRIAAPPRAVPAPAGPPRPKVARAAPAVPHVRRPVPVARVAMTHVANRVEPTLPPVPRPAQAAPAGGGFSAEQRASLDAQFRNTISAAQRAVFAGPPQRGESSQARTLDRAAAADERRNVQIMGGTPQEFREMRLITGGGDCVPLQGPFPSGRLKGYYIKCIVRYSDAFSEEVSFPWPFYFAPGKDPFDYRDNPNDTMTFPGQDPPPGFTLSPNFALSRTVCAYYKGRCSAILEAEKARGEYIKPP